MMQNEKAFEEYWENYGELHASMCGGDIKRFAKEIWMSALGASGDKSDKHKEDVFAELRAKIAEFENDLKQVNVKPNFQVEVLISRIREVIE